MDVLDGRLDPAHDCRTVLLLFDRLGVGARQQGFRIEQGARAGAEGGDLRDVTRGQPVLTVLAGASLAPCDREVTLVGVVGDGLVLLSNDAPQLLGLGGGVARCCRVARQIGGGSVIDFIPDVNGKVRLICGSVASLRAKSLGIESC